MGMLASKAKTSLRASNRGATRAVMPIQARMSVMAILSRFTLAVLLLSFVGGAIWYWPKFTSRPVNAVMISGDLQYVTENQIQHILQPQLVDGLLDIPLANVRAEIEALPWVDQASVARVWPDGVDVHVVEQRAVARWGETQLLNHRGQIFTPVNIDEFSSWPKLAGPTGNRFDVMQHYLSLNRLLQDRNMKLNSLSQDVRGAWTAELSDGPILVFGRGELIEKIQRLFVVYDKQLYRYIDKAKKVDLRYRNGIAVQWREAVAADNNLDVASITENNVANISATQSQLNVNHDSKNRSAVI